MRHSIITVRAHLDDSSSLARLLEQLPNSDGLASVLSHRGDVSTRAYDDASEIARFVRSDGKQVTCMTVAGVTIDEAEMIAAQCELLDVWSDEQLEQAVQVALAEDLSPRA